MCMHEHELDCCNNKSGLWWCLSLVIKSSLQQKWTEDDNNYEVDDDVEKKWD